MAAALLVMRNTHQATTLPSTTPIVKAIAVTYSVGMTPLRYCCQRFEAINAW